MEEAHRRAMKEDLEVYSGMRVEVTSGDSRIFLVARLLELRGDRAQLEPGAEVLDGLTISRNSIGGAEQEIVTWVNGLPVNQ